ncbi:MAG: hypothetical protein V3W32_11300, partial [Gemmatimonadota bacterium]
MRRILLGAIALAMLAPSFAEAQEVHVLEQGDTLSLRFVAAEVEPEIVEVPVPGPTIYDTVYACPPDFATLEDGESWTCEAPSVSVPPASPTGVALSIDGTALVTEWQHDGAGVNFFEVLSGHPDGEYRGRDTLPPTARSVRRDSLVAGVQWSCVWALSLDYPRGEAGCNNVVFEPPPAATYLLSVAPEPYSMSGDLEVVEGVYSVHLDRSDGAWQGIGDVTVPGVGPVRFCSGGACNDEYRLPFELGGGKIDLAP